MGGGALSVTILGATKRARMVKKHISLIHSTSEQKTTLGTLKIVIKIIV